MKTQQKADIMLALVALIWGGAYLLLKLSLSELQVFNLIGLRFIIAFVIAGIVFNKRLRKVDFKTLKFSFFLAFILFLVYITATYGISMTSVSNAGFLISLTVIFVPIVAIVFLKQKIELKVLFAVVLAVIGIGLLTLNGEVSIGFGDLLCILCAFITAFHILLTGKLTTQVDSISLGVFQLGFVGLFGTVFSFCTETVKLPVTPKIWIAVLIMSVFATAAAFIIQTTAQKYTSPAHTSLILSLEPVFCAVFAYIFAGEVLSLNGYIGASILLVSIFMVELDLKAFRKKEAA